MNIYLFQHLKFIDTIKMSPHSAILALMIASGLAASKELPSIQSSKESVDIRSKNFDPSVLSIQLGKQICFCKIILINDIILFLFSEQDYIA